MDYGLIYIIIGFALGGVLKGATGAGAPIIAVPVIALFYDVPLAVAIFIVPNFLANIWQIKSHYADRLPGSFVAKFAGAGTLGAAFGTMMLVSLSGETLKLVVAIAMLLYIGFRLLRPDWALSYRIGSMLSLPVGGLAGLMQGATGISAPISITFLNAMKLERGQFIFTISVFFITMLAVQIPILYHYGVLTFERLLMSCGSAAVLLAFMPVGTLLARRFSRQTFDRVILGVLMILALRLCAEALL